MTIKKTRAALPSPHPGPAAAEATPGFVYDSHATRAEVRQIVRTLTEALKLKWRGGECDSHKIFGSLDDVMKYKTLPAFSLALFLRMCATAFIILFLFFLAAGIVSFFIGAAQAAELIETPMASGAYYLAAVGAVNVLAFSVAWFMESKNLATDIRDLKLHATKQCNEIVDACNEYIRVQALAVNGHAGMVSPYRADKEQLKMGEHVAGALKHWRALERMPHYLRHDWDMYVRDCRDQREFKKHIDKRLRQHILGIMGVVVSLGATISVYVWLTKAAGNFNPMISALLQAGVISFGVTVLLGSIYAAYSMRKYTASSKYVSFAITEALRSHKKERALEILGVDFRDFITTLHGKKAESWGDWDPDYQRRLQEKLEKEGLEGAVLKQRISADPVIYVGNASSIRMTILDADPASMFVDNLQVISSI